MRQNIPNTASVPDRAPGGFVTHDSRHDCSFFASHHEADDEPELWSESDSVACEGDTETQCDSESSPALEAIESLVLSFLTQLASATSPPVEVTGIDGDGDAHEPLKKSSAQRPPQKLRMQLADRRKQVTDRSMGMRTLVFPRNSRGASSKPFAQLFKVADIVHEALTDDLPVTKRDIYYRDVPLFKSQSTVDRLVDDLAATYQLERSDLNVRATCKGLICGSNLTIHLQSGESISVNDFEGTLIPAGEDISMYSLDDHVAWVLIVEKDAIFQTLCKLKLTDCPEMPGRGLLVTGKGYPDIATRQLVKSLCDNLPPTTPILALVDGDPYGLDILSVFKYGSFALRHESEKLAAERVRWLGIRASELLELGVQHDALIPITKADEKKALFMLSRPKNNLPSRWRKELMRMLHTRRKAEIEILSTCSSTSADLSQKQYSDERSGRPCPAAVAHDPANTDAKIPTSVGDWTFSTEDMPDKVPVYRPEWSDSALHLDSSSFQAARLTSRASPILRYLACKLRHYVEPAGMFGG